MSIFGKLLGGLISNEDVELSISGTSYSGWESISVTRNLESISGGFTVSLYDSWRGDMSSWTIKPGDEVTVNIGSTPVICGYVDAVESSFSADSRSISVTGRDKAADLVDCSIISKESQIKDKTMTEIATMICEPFGISVSAETDVGEPFKTWDIQQGETVFENLERMSKLRGVLVISKNDGSIKIIRAGEDRATDAIIQGENLKSGSVSYDNSTRFSEYTTKGQSKGSDKTNGKNASQNKDQATDAGVTRYRPLLVVSEGSSDKKTTKSRAEWEATVRAAKSFKLSIVVAGWRQSTGDLWEINQRVMVTAGFAGVSGDLLISSVTFQKDDSVGTVTNMELVRPDAYKPEPTVQKNVDSTAKSGNSNASDYGWD